MGFNTFDSHSTRSDKQGEKEFATSNLRTITLSSISGSCLIAVILMLASCGPKNELLKRGTWRGEFELPDRQKVPVTFVVSSDSSGQLVLHFVNGKERASYSGLKIKNDSLLIPLDIYDSYIVASVSNGHIDGFYRKNSGTTKGIPFQADHGQDHRFELTSTTPVTNLSGTWDVTITSDDSAPNETVGFFEQHENEITGTIMAITGDYRFFAGSVDNDQLLLSAFSGSSPRLIKGVIKNDSTFEAELVGATGKSTLHGRRNQAAALPNPYQLTYLKDSTQIFDFTFPDLDGNPVSLKDKKYEGKIKIICITGSWCPNCLDEAEFLSPWYKDNKDRGVEIVALSFERKDDLEFSKEKIQTFIKRFDIQYDVLFAGKSDKKEASKKLPQLNAVLAYPTLIFIDAEGQVRKIHTGFTGPATGKYYDEFILEFNTIVIELLNEGSAAAL